jgi:dTDP-4-amino-4,6-dideoxygalactose transaminase
VIALFDLSRQHAAIAAELQAALARVAGGGGFTFGEELDAFEDEFARYCGVRRCAGVANGTDALTLALRALGAGPGTEVVTAAHTFFATAEAIVATGACPVFADIDPRTRCVSPSAVAAALSDRTAAVVPVHLYGHPAPMPEIMSVCDAAGIPVVEDAAQAHGATIDGRRVGSWGRAGTFSFYPTKNLGALGDAGAVVSDDEELIATVRSLRHHGCAADDPNCHLRFGGTARLDSLQAAFLRVKLPRLDGWNEERRDAADRYRDALAGLDLTLPGGDAPGARQVHHLFVVEVDDRDRVLAALRAQGIGAAVHYPCAVPLQPAFAGRFARGEFPVAEALAARALSLPVFPGITAQELDRVARSLESALTRADLAA